MHSTLKSKYPAVVHIAEQIRCKLALEEDSAQALAVWSRLVCDSRMLLVWKELYKSSSRDREQFKYPGRVSNKSVAAGLRQRASEIRNRGEKLSEAEADLLKVFEYEAALLEKAKDAPADARWSEQDRAVQLFFSSICEAALHCNPILLSDLKAKAKDIRDVAKRLRAESPTKTIKEARILSELADDLEDEARDILPERNPDGSKYKPGVDDPWIVTRRRGNYEIRTFLADLMISTETLFATPLWGTIATIANVIFDRQDITRMKVREMFRC
jgi:hypothetical protein